MSTSRPNGYTSYRGISRETRPSSAELIDLHVYIVPPEIWRERYNNLLNQNVTETISAGIIRVHPERFVYDLRNELEQQVGEDMLPRDYVFLKSVGRSITRLKQKQEYQLKAKHFIPPQAYAPELYLLEISPDDQGSSRTSTRPHSPFSQNHEKITQVKKVGKKKDSTKVLPKIQEMKLKPRKDGVPEAKREDERRSGNKSKHRHNDSSPYRYSPLPKIKSGHSPTHNRGEYNHNGDIRTENGRLSDSWGSNRDKRTPPPPQNVPRTPQHPKASRDQTPREHTSRGESHRAPPPRSSPTPTDHRKRADQSREPVSGTYTNHTNEDSGINVNSPEDHFDALDRRKHDEDRNNDLNQRLHPDNEDDHHRNGDISDDEWERRRREEEERRRRESEERRMKEDEDRRKEEEERRRLEEERERISKQQLTGSDEEDSLSPENTPTPSNEGPRMPAPDLNRFPSPPPLQMDSNQGQETESSKQNKKAEKAVTKPPFSKQETKQEIKERLMKELEAAREARRAVEKQREELVKKAKLMQTKTQNRRNHDMMNVFDARDLWKKRYFEEKKKTPPLEEQCNRLRHELDIIHRKLMNTLEGPSKEKSTRLGDLKPSQKNNYKIQATRLTHEIDDMRRRLENAKMKLTAEMKLRNQAETELRALRAELTQQKIQLTLARSQQMAKLTPTTHDSSLDSRLLTSSYS
ncbi:spermatogenesis-associated protein 1 isoform X12 [Magallana gigas]|uniref:spermatogenesis-associated protein 1 isoform X12 n=1 Tax=Magallana gigas TaxID=29159 RepID=UPI0033426DE2